MTGNMNRNGRNSAYWAAHHGRREVYVGAQTVGAIIGNKLVQHSIDDYLGRIIVQKPGSLSSRRDPVRLRSLQRGQAFVPSDVGRDKYHFLVQRREEYRSR